MNEFNELYESKINEGTGVLKLYHGTSDKNAKLIKKSGLKNTTGSPEWFMLSDHIDDALFHSESGSGNPVVIEFHLPDTKDMLDLNPYLWSANKASRGNWYAIRDVLPAKFIKKIHKVSKAQISNKSLK